MDNQAIARIFAEVGDLLELKGENPFKIRAYRNASETIGHLGDQLSGLTPARRLEIPGIGKDLAAKIGELLDTGACRYHQDLLAEFPAAILDLLRLQNVGPKTAARLYRELGIASLDDLERAARDGRIRRLKGMGSGKEALILRAIEERHRFGGRRLTAEVQATGLRLMAALQEREPDAALTLVGSVRRRSETCGDLDILAAGAPSSSLMDAFAEHGLVERVLARGDTKSSVMVQGALQADLRVVPRESLGAALQYFTGSKAHNIALRDRALQRGLKLNEYGLFQTADDRRVAGGTEEDIYAALDLDWIPPELRENRGEIDRAAAHALPRLIERRDLRGDLHMHTTATDGKADAESMARAARAAGLEYIAITDHSKSLAMANGLDETRALAHAREIRSLNDRLDGITVLAGIECDIRSDGTMDLAEDCLAELDIVIASIHSAFSTDVSEMTDRVLRAIACPWVDVLGHPTGRMLLKRSGYPLDFDRVMSAAGSAGVALEINSQIHRLDLDDVHAAMARERGVMLMIDSDAHSPAALDVIQWGVDVARRAWIEPRHVLNTRPLDRFRASLRRARR